MLYRSVPHPLWAPGRLEAAARLHGFAGLSSGPLRVLDIGCGSGGNALAIAARHPEWHVVGFDIDEEAIALGRRMAKEANITGCDLRVADLLTIRAGDLPGGPFDVVMLHGMLSWLPEQAVTAAWDLASETLSATGLLAIDYHALPGFRLRQIARDVLRGCTDPEAARERLRSVANANVTGGAYAATLAAEAERIGERDDSIMLYDELLADVRGFALEDMVDMAGQRDLNFIGGASPGDWWAFHDPATIAADADLPADRIERAARADQIRGVAFHISLFGYGNSFSDIDASRVGELYVERRSRPAGSSQANALNYRPVHEQALERIGKAHAPVRAREVDVQPDRADDDGATVILQLAADGAVALTTMPFVRAVPSDRPRVWALARASLQEGEWAPTQLHDHVEVPDPMVRALLIAMDGTRSIDELADLLRAWGSAHDRADDATRAAGSLTAHVDQFAALGLID